MRAGYIVLCHALMWRRIQQGLIWTFEDLQMDAIFDDGVSDSF